MCYFNLIQRALKYAVREFKWEGTKRHQIIDFMSELSQSTVLTDMWFSPFILLVLCIKLAIIFNFLINLIHGKVPYTRGGYFIII